MTPDPREIASLPLPDDLRIHFETTVGELRKMLAAADASAKRQDLTLEAFAQRINRAISTARGLCASGKVPGAYRMNGRDWWIPETALDAFLRAQKPPTKEKRGARPIGARQPVRLDQWRREEGLPARKRPRGANR